MYLNGNKDVTFISNEISILIATIINYISQTKNLLPIQHYRMTLEVVQKMI